jgi:hypothetical protein
MDKKPVITKKRIGLILSGDYNWVGGLYYILNIIKALNLMDSEHQPKVVVLFNNNIPQDIINEVHFDFVSLVNINKECILIRAISKISRIIFKYNLFFHYLCVKYKLGYIYPLTEYNKDLSFLNNKIFYWIPDFQHKFYSSFFTEDEIKKRDYIHNQIASKAKNIVLSSNDAYNHFKIFNTSSKANVHVLPFVSIINFKEIVPFEEIKIKYNIDTSYFIVSNQFWGHKNHMVIFNALFYLKNVLKQKVLIVFTGKIKDKSNFNYINRILSFIEENELQTYVKILGFVDRNEQLSLLKNSIAVIQPSKFEGWSTVVEDAKALNKHVILSDIDIHREQISKNCTFFKVDDYIKLAEIIYNFKNIEKNSIDNNEYQKNIDKFNSTFLKIFQ